MTDIEVAVVRADPRRSDATALLQASHALMQDLFEPEENHFLSIDELCVPSISFFVAEIDGRAVGCGALAAKAGYGELKSMFVDESARGQGVADLILSALEHEARSLKLDALKLEIGDILEAAHRLYYRRGFEKCGAFGDYVENSSSVFMQKAFT